MVHALSVDPALEARAQSLYEENQLLGYELEKLNRQKSQWDGLLREAQLEAMKLEEKCRVLETENETLRRYINS